MDGIILINKEKDYTSRDIVNIISKKLHTKKVGHTGTLDPAAEGLLVICVGKATKLVEVLTHDEKEYEATILLGKLTDTLDLEGVTLKEEKAIKTKAQIENVLSHMIGTYEQEVPIYSAVKVNGKKLYEYARNHEEVTLPKRNVIIKELTLISEIEYKNKQTIFQIRCVVSKGTYIRSLVRDIATNLKTVGTMTKLVRTKVGNFNLSDSESVNNDDYNIIPISKALETYPKVIVDEELALKIKNGTLIENKYHEEKILFQTEKEILAIYKIYEKDKSLMKPWKMLN